jgi:diguanylate cyclase (GGDEF)-like protein
MALKMVSKCFAQVFEPGFLHLICTNFLTIFMQGVIIETGSYDTSLTDSNAQHERRKRSGMNLVYNTIINVYSMFFLVIIFIHSVKHDEKDVIQYKIFMSMLCVTAILLIADTLGRFDGNPGTIFSVMNCVGNFIVFAISLVLPSLWLVYAHKQIYHNKRIITGMFWILIPINIMNVIMVVVSQYNGMFYCIDSNNIYHRGSYYFVEALLSVLLIMAGIILVIINRKKLEQKQYYALLLFVVPPLICILLQMEFYGYSLTLNGSVLSLMIAFINIQNCSFSTDYLTGVNTRKRLESYLRKKIRKSSQWGTFSSIMLDINNFKCINDTFGHDMGDKALKTVADILYECLGVKDFVARYGGDEFWIVLSISEKKELEEIAQKIKQSFRAYNKTGSHPYKLDVSMGYAIYDYNSDMKLEDYQKHIDLLMYQDKKKKF